MASGFQQKTARNETAERVSLALDATLRPLAGRVELANNAGMRLFPWNWFSAKSPASQAQAAVWWVRHWRAQLASSLSLVLKRPISREGAVDALQALENRHFLALDQALRHGEWGEHSDHPGQSSVQLRHVDMLHAEREALLFTVACDANGFDREKALFAFADRPGRLAMAAALIRSDDWVPQVRAAGRLLLQQLSDQACGAALFEHLEIVVAMRARKRFAAEVWPVLIEPVLLQPENAERRWQAAQQGSSAVRRFACAFVADNDPARIHDICRLAANDSDPGLARWGLETSIRRLSTSDTQALAAEMLRRHPHGSVRSAALYRLASVDATAARDAVEAALLDRSRSVRHIAAYLVRRLFDIDPADRWRAALLHVDTRRGEFAVESLADVAQPDDAERLLPWLNHRKGRIRAAALRGLERAKYSQTIGVATAALQDATTTVVRDAIAVLHRSPGALTKDLLLSARIRAANDRTTALVIHSARLLDKWDELETYLIWYAELGSVWRPTLLRELEVWRRAAWRRFTPLSDAARTRIEQRLTLLDGTLPTKIATEFKHTVAHA